MSPPTVADPLKLVLNLNWVAEAVKLVTSIKSGLDVRSHLCDAAEDHCAVLPSNPLAAFFINSPVLADSIIYKLSQLSSTVLAGSLAISIVTSAELDEGFRLSVTVVV
mgnify:CR=1 FL=1